VRRHVHGLVAALAIASALAACSDSENAADTSGPAGTSPFAPTTIDKVETDVQDAESDQAMANEAVLTATDIGPAWSEQPRDDGSNPEDDALFSAVVEAEPACSAWAEKAEAEGVSISEFEIVPDAPIRAESPAFLVEPSLASEVEHTVSVYPTTEAAAATFDVARSSEVLPCIIAAFDDILQAAFDANSPGVLVTDFTSTTEGPDLGDDAFHSRFSVTIEAPDGSTTDFTFDTSAIRVGRAVSNVSQNDVQSEIDDPDAIIIMAFNKVVGVFGAND
jgi:hypothetical protein